MFINALVYEARVVQKKKKKKKKTMRFYSGKKPKKDKNLVGKG